MVVLFTYFYTAITVNPNQMADDMKKNGGFIPGIKPGRATSEYLDSVMSRITFPGFFIFRICCYSSCFCDDFIQNGYGICSILWRNFTINFSSSCT